MQGGVGWNTSNLRDNSGFNSGDFQGTGVLVGGTLGWNWQAPGSPWVLGVEGDFSWANLRARTANPGCFASDCRTNVEWLATVRGRLGHANGPLFFYVTGGVAWASVFGQEGTPPFLATNGGNATVTKTGWTVGAGLEGALGGGWSIKGEYLYVDFGRDNYFPLVLVPVVTDSISTRLHIVRAGVNYKF